MHNSSVICLVMSLTLTLCLPVAVQAQDTAVPVTIQPSVSATNEYDVTEITVTGHLPGPALWRVKKGESEVYIVGSLPVMLKRFDWNNDRVMRILAKSNVFLTHPEVRPGAIGFVKWQMAKGNGPFRSLYDVLPRPLADRFRQTAIKNGLNPKTYAGDSPVYAVMRLRDDVYEKRGLATNNPEKNMEILSRHKTPSRPIATYSAAKMIGKLDSMTAGARQSCVTATLDEIDFASTHAAAASKAWAVADLKTARDNSPSSATLACLEGAGSTRAMLDQATADTVAAINAALQTPGKSMIVLPLSVLLHPNGALEQLKAQGAEVSQPEI